MQVPIRTRSEAKTIINTRDDLAGLLGVEPTFISALTCDPAAQYTEFSIPKKDGGKRTIRPPKKPLRRIQRLLLRHIYERVVLPHCLHGGVPGKSIFTHARGHMGHNMVATLDIHKFFPSTTRSHVEPVLASIGFRSDALEDLLAMVLLNNELPQGAPTSSILANLAFASADIRFLRLARRRSLRYSRFVDDIAVSGNSLFPELRGTLIEFIIGAGYKVAPGKIDFTPHSRRQIVTGLVVNDKLRPTKEFISDLKHTIRLCIELGPHLVADDEGVSVKMLKARLTGRVSHVAQADYQTGKRFRGLLRGVQWRLSANKLPTTYPAEGTGRQ